MKGLLIACVRFYQQWVSPFLPRRCRFYPTCSAYMVQVLNSHGVVKGLGLGVWRVCKCHPFTREVSIFRQQNGRVRNC